MPWRLRLPVVGRHTRRWVADVARAERKAQRAAVSVQLDRGFSDELPYPAASFDRVFSSFMFHHLKPPEKQKTLSEALRVLAPGGSLQLVDLGGSESRTDGLLARLLHSSENLRDNIEGRIPDLMTAAGFADASEIGHRATVFGRITYYHGSLPVTGSGTA